MVVVACRREEDASRMPHTRILPLRACVVIRGMKLTEVRLAACLPVLLLPPSGSSLELAIYGMVIDNNWAYCV